MPVFLKYGTIKGDATEPAHRGWIELGSVQLGSFRRISSDRERPHASPSITDITATKRSDGASVALQREALTGKAVDAVIDFVDGGGSVFLRLELSGTMISSWSITGGGDTPTESLTLNFTKIEFKNTPGTPPP